MAIRTELNLRLPNSPGALTDICRLLASERVDILALALEASGHLRLVVDNHVHGAALLREQHHQVTERDVIAMRVPHTAGGAAPAMRLLSDLGINVEYAYGGAEEGGRTATVIVGVADAQRAAAAAGL
ncbi:MAG TPA: hypothetical protein VGJ29_01735 [Vicinamibacterales bacterium]|jgi:hypothetical protein